MQRGRWRAKVEPLCWCRTCADPNLCSAAALPAWWVARPRPMYSHGSTWPQACLKLGQPPPSLDWIYLSTSDTCFKLCQGHERDSWKDIPSSAFGLLSPTLPLLKSLRIYHSVKEKNDWSLSFHPLAWEKWKCCAGL